MPTRVDELRTVLQTKVTELQEFTSGPGIKIEGNNVTVSAEDAAKVKKLMNECQEIRDMVQASEAGVSYKDWLSAPKVGEGGAVGLGTVVGGNEDGEAKDFLNGLGRQSLGQAFTKSEIFVEFQKSGSDKMSKPWEVEQHDIARERKDIYGSLASHNVAMGVGTVVQFDPMVPRPQRPVRVRDLFPAAATSANLIDYFKVTGFAENSGVGAAATVPDYASGTFGLKPHSNLQFTSAQAPVRTIAHWEAAHRNIIQDVPQLQATIDNELRYGLSLVEDAQILNGDGTGENLLGILNTSGIQIYTPGGGEIKSDSMRRASTLAVLANLPPSGYVLHPNDWEDVELQKGSGDGQYMLVTNIAVGIAAQVWRQPVVETPAITEGTFLNGAFGTGAQLYDRQQVNVRIADQHADFFVRNAVVILCEERLALAVKRPEAFVKGTFA